VALPRIPLRDRIPQSSADLLAGLGGYFMARRERGDKKEGREGKGGQGRD